MDLSPGADSPMNRKNLVATLAAIAGLLAPAGASAQDYPSKPILIIAPFSPGTAVDFVARLAARSLAEQFKTSVAVENRMGASSQIGAAAVAKATPDGHTLLFTSPAHYINRSLYKNLPYDPVKDFKPVMRVSNAMLVLVVPKAAPVGTQAELIAYIRARPGKLSYSSAGSGSTTQLPAALFNSMANLDVTHIPYKSGAQALTDTISGEVFMTMTAITTAQPHIKAGTLKAIGVSGMARSHSLPEVPTIAEGGLPGYEFVSWNGLLAPAGTPNEVVARLEAALTRAVASAEFRERLLGAGLEPEPLGARAFADRLLVEIPMWERLVKISGAKAE